MNVELDTAQLEHLALRAAEFGDGHVEHCCNMALAVRGAKLGNLTYEQILLSIIGEEPRYSEWMKLGANTGYRMRQ